MTDGGPARLFVYGTLLPGDVRWGLLAPFVVDEGVEDHVPGLLFDTGLDYPAASFATHAERLRLTNPERHADPHTERHADPIAPAHPDRRGVPTGDRLDDRLDARTVVLGRTFALLDATLGDALEVLDREEDLVTGLYRRVVVVTGRGMWAWAYASGTGLELTPIPSGDWLAHRGLR